MRTIMAKFKLRPDKQEEGEQALAEMVAAVAADEPGALLYMVSRSASDPSEVIFFEAYKDGEAMSAHMSTPHFKALQVKLAQLIDPTSVKIERGEQIAGVLRGA
jgi:quinol monooxygenase YgiN